MDEKEKKSGKTRRKFLDNGLKIGLLATVSSLSISKLFGSDSKSSTGKTVELMTTDGTLIEVDASEVQEVSEEKDYKPREGFKNKKFVMVIDLARCKNAKKCQSACNKHHYITGENAWLKIYNMQEKGDEDAFWMPTICQHCDKPPCVKVCPVDATFKRRDGIVLIDNERCIGCRFCMAACPYSARVFNWSEPQQSAEVKAMPHNVEYDGVPSAMGTVDKCDFCPHMIQKGELPHCVTACPNGVFFFGDKYEDTVTNGDETYRLSELLEKNAGYRLMEDLGTEPSVYYLPPKDRLQPFKEGLDNYEEFNSVDKTKQS